MELSCFPGSFTDTYLSNHSVGSSAIEWQEFPVKNVFFGLKMEQDNWFID